MAQNLDPLFFFGRPFGPIYGVIMKIREKLYTKQVFRQHRLNVPVISVGNLVLGGTGKTPTVIYLAQLLKNNGYKVAVVSRGYGGHSREAVNVVSDGENKYLNPQLYGDEPVLIASVLDNTPVITGKKRIFPCIHAIEEYGVNCILLDDGFQHMGVHRDINLVLFESQKLAGNSRIFPGGPLREPVAALNRANAFLMTGQTKENQKRSSAFAKLLSSRFPATPVFISAYCKPSLKAKEGPVEDISTIGSAFIFCAIANPERVLHSAREMGLEVVASRYLKDHQDYSQARINSLCDEAKKAGATCLITTAKDHVKVTTFNFSLPIYILQVEQDPEQGFQDYILHQLKNLH